MFALTKIPISHLFDSKQRDISSAQVHKFHIRSTAILTHTLLFVYPSTLQFTPIHFHPYYTKESS